MIAVDDREREVYNNLLSYNIQISKQRLATGDFIIFHKDEPKIIVERKTWKDFASSIKDGRIISQSESMHEHQEKFNMRLVIILEGLSVLPNEDKIIEGILAKAIYTKIRRLYLFHNISTIYSKSIEHTAEILINFISDYDSLQNDQSKLGTNESNSSNYLDTNKGSRKKADEEILIGIWTCFPGVGEKIAKVLMKKMSIVDFMKINEKDLEIIMKSNNLRCGKKTLEKIMNSRTSISKKLLCEIPTIGDKKASLILESKKIEEIISSPEILESLKPNITKRHINSIKKYVNMILEEKKLEEQFNILDLTNNSDLKNLMSSLLSKNIEAWKWLIELLEKSIVPNEISNTTIKNI